MTNDAVLSDLLLCIVMSYLVFAYLSTMLPVLVASVLNDMSKLSTLQFAVLRVCAEALDRHGSGAEAGDAAAWSLMSYAPVKNQ